MIGPAIILLLCHIVASRFLERTPPPNVHSRLLQTNCSKYWDPSPCACYRIERIENGKVLICKNITSQSALQKVFGRLKKTIDIDAFALVYSGVQSLSKGIFGKAMFRAAHFEQNDLEAIEPGAFEGMEGTLRSITFLHNKIKHLNFTSKARKLRNFFAYEEQFEEISDHAFANLAHLTSFWIMRCPLKSIGNYAFENTSRLRRFRILGNTAAITKIGDYAFNRPDCEIIGRIELGGTQLTDEALSSTAFVNANVYSLRLQGNNLTTLREEVFSPLLESANARRRSVFIPGNPVVCDSSLKWIVANQTAQRLFRLGWCYKDGRRISISRLKESDL